MGNYGAGTIRLRQSSIFILIGKTIDLFVRTDHKNLVYLADSTVPKLVRWRIIPSEFKYLIEHIPGTSNVVADGLTRVRWIEGNRHSDSKRHMFYNDSIERIFRLGGEDLLDGEYGGYIEVENEVNDNLEDKELTERFVIFWKYHNSIVGHFGIRILSRPCQWGVSMEKYAK